MTRVDLIKKKCKICWIFNKQHIFRVKANPCSENLHQSHFKKIHGIFNVCLYTAALHSTTLLTLS